MKIYKNNAENYVRLYLWEKHKINVNINYMRMYMRFVSEGRWKNTRLIEALYTTQKAAIGLPNWVEAVCYQLSY